MKPSACRGIAARCPAGAATAHAGGPCPAGGSPFISRAGQPPGGTRTLQANPQLQATIQATINGSSPGEVRYLLVHAAVDGRVTVTDFKIDPDRLNRDTLAVAVNPDAQEER